MTRAAAYRHAVEKREATRSRARARVAPVSGPDRLEERRGQRLVVEGVERVLQLDGEEARPARVVVNLDGVARLPVALSRNGRGAAGQGLARRGRETKREIGAGGGA